MAPNPNHCERLQAIPLLIYVLGQSRERIRPFATLPILKKTHTIAALFKTQIPPHPQSKPGQANPSPGKQIQIKRLGFTWFYSSESGLINGLQRFQIRIFSPRLFASLATRASPPAPPFSDDCNDVGRLLLFAR
jgi:hypothetical protein